MVDLTISIVNTNNKALLEECLGSIFENTLTISIEVYVIDNASNDGSAEMVGARFPQVSLIKNERRKGYAANHNRALRKSKGRYACILNEDIVIYPKALDKMVDFMDRHPDVGAIGPQILCDDSVTIQLECARVFPTLWTEFCEKTNLSKSFPSSRVFRDTKIRYWPHNDTREVDCLLGACMIVRRETMEEVGLLDEDFFMYGEDVEWPYRIKKAGWKIVFLHEAQVLHYGGQTNQRRPRRMGIEAFNSQYKLFRKLNGRLYAQAYKGLMLLVTVGKILLFSGKFVMNRKQDARERCLEKIKSHGRVMKWIFTNTVPDSGDRATVMGDPQLRR